MLSETQIKELMIEHFPRCPLCGSRSSYKVTSAIKGHIQCKSCGAEWSSPDFVELTELKTLRIIRLPRDLHLLADEEHAIGQYEEYPIEFWKSLAETEGTKVSLTAIGLSEILLLALILAVATYLRVVNLDGFYIYDYDEGVYTESARMILMGYLPHVQVFSSQPPHFILLVAAFMRLFGMSIVAARLFIVVTSLIGIVSVHLIAKRIEDFKAGLIAAFLLSISPYFLRQSRSVQSEVPSISFVLMGVWLFFEGYRFKNDMHLFLSGLATCLGTMMKLNVGLVAPLVLVLLISQRKLKEAAFFVVGCIIPLLILPLFNLGKVIDQMVLFHFAKPETGAWQDRWRSIGGTLMMDVGLLVTALVGTAVCAIKKELEGRFIALFTAITFLFLLCYRSYFQHQTVILVPLLAVMSGVALVAPMNLGLRMLLKQKVEDAQRTGGPERGGNTQTRRREKSFLAGLIVANLLLSVFYCVTAVSVVRYDQSLVSPKDDATYRDAVKVIRSHADSTEYIIADEQILAFLAERDVPPDLVDTSYMRISSGYLDSETVKKLAEQYKVDVIVLWTGRLKRLSDFVSYVKLNYTLVKDYGGGRVIYVKS